MKKRPTLMEMGVPTEVVRLWMENKELTGVTDVRALPHHVVSIAPYNARYRLSHVPRDSFVVHCDDFDELPILVAEHADRVVDKNGGVWKDRWKTFVRPDDPSKRPVVCSPNGATRRPTTGRFFKVSFKIETNNGEFASFKGRTWLPSGDPIVCGIQAALSASLGLDEKKP